MTRIRLWWRELYFRRILTRPCNGSCGDASSHDAHLTRYGRRNLRRRFRFPHDQASK